MAPVWETNASSNYEKYSNPEFDKLLKEGLAAKTPEDANKKFNEAQEILFKDLPGLPMWYQNRAIVWSNNVVSAETGWNGGILYYDIEAK